MHDNLTLITNLTAALGSALILGFIAARLRLPVIVGYLLAGVLIGPATPGFVADLHLSQQLAEIGIMLLMFGVGLHLSLADLLAVRRIAIPGAVAQILIATALGAGAAALWGWSLPAGIVFGLALSVASTVVLLRALEDRGVLDSINGRIAVGWLVVEEPLRVLMVVAIIIVGKSLAAFLIVLSFRYPLNTALTVSASLAQIGEFSFVLAGLGVASRTARSSSGCARRACRRSAAMPRNPRC